MRLAQQSSGGKELMQRGQPACGSSSGFGLVGRGHGERGLMIAYPVLIVGFLCTRSYVSKNDAPKKDGCLLPILNIVRPCRDRSGGLRHRRCGCIALLQRKTCSQAGVQASKSRRFRSRAAESEAAKGLGHGGRV